MIQLTMGSVFDTDCGSEIDSDSDCEYFVASSSEEDSDGDYGLSLHIQELIESAKTAKSDKASKVVAPKKSTCSICLGKMTKGTKLRCGHIVHTDCYVEWIDSNYKCPECNKIEDDVQAYRESRDIEYTKKQYDTTTAEHTTVFCIECGSKSRQLKDKLRNQCYECKTYNTINL